MTLQFILEIASPRKYTGARNDKAVENYFPAKLYNHLVMYTYYVYILTNKTNNVLYTGVTNDIDRRILEHRSLQNHGFTAQYNVHKLVYYEEFNDIEEAIAREKQIKGGSRQKKIDLINELNPKWEELFPEE